MDTTYPDWMPDASKLTYPGWVQRKEVTLSKRDQKRGGSGNAEQSGLASALGVPMTPIRT
jgi:hypothetical protein